MSSNEYDKDERSPLFGQLRKHFSLVEYKTYESPKAKETTGLHQSVIDEASIHSAYGLRVNNNKKNFFYVKKFSLNTLVVLCAIIVTTSLLLLVVIHNNISSSRNGRNDKISNNEKKNFVVAKNTILTTKAANADRIESLPLSFDGMGSNTLLVPQWSGFLNASESTPGTYLHYWFAHYDGDNNNDDSNHDTDDNDGAYYYYDDNQIRNDTSIPVILWLNGGPGSSSIIGMLTELGPYILNEKGTSLIPNPYSWTKVGHLFVLESPAGVGFSFCGNWTSNNTGVCDNSDKSTAKDAYAAISDFYKVKFPSLQNNPLYITGESYAGIYVPTLAKEIVDHNSKFDSFTIKDKIESNSKRQSASPPSAIKIPLMGIAVGDPCTDNDSQRKEFDMIWYSHKYGLITDELYSILHDDCKLRDGDYLYYYDDKNNESNMNPDENIMVKESGLLMTRKCHLAYRKYLLTSSYGISQGFKEKYINPYALLEPVDQPYNDALSTYMNRKDVQVSLNIVKEVTEETSKKRTVRNSRGRNNHDDTLKTVPIFSGINTNWSSYAGRSGRKWTYENQYDACNPDWYDVPKKERPPSMIDIYREILPTLKGNNIIYNGDYDPCITYEGTRKAVDGIGFNVLEGGDYRPWFYEGVSTSEEILSSMPIEFGSFLTNQDEGVQYGGSVISYENNLSFVVVHGSGHMVPQTRPRPALHLLKYLVSSDGNSRSSSLLSPTLVSDDAIQNMTNDEFKGYTVQWTSNAKQQGREVRKKDEATGLTSVDHERV